MAEKSGQPRLRSPASAAAVNMASILKQLMKQISLSNVHLDEILCRTIQSNCKELHLRIGQSPLTRFCNDDLPGELSEFEAFTLLDLTQIVYAILTDEQITQLESEKELKFPYSVARIAKFDVHIVRAKGNIEAEFHRIPSATLPTA